jgi:hypothetical protein
MLIYYDARSTKHYTSSITDMNVAVWNILYSYYKYAIR